MKALNHSSVVKGYLTFSGCMALVVCLFIGMCYCFISTSASESAKVEKRSLVFDRVFSTQVDMVERVDSLYNYMSLINSNNRVNNILVQNMTSTMKMRLLDDMENMEKKDMLLYKNLLPKVNRFLTVKDSVRILEKQKNTLTADLRRCIDAEHAASRKLSLQGAKTINTNGNGN